MKTVLTFGASTSSESINVQLARFAGSQLKNAKAKVIDLNAFEMPIFNVDRQKEDGVPEEAKAFSDEIVQSDGILVSLAEHNGTYTAAFKNILDWSSRIHGGKLWQKKPMLVLSASPGERAAKKVHDLALAHWPFMDADIVSSFSLPSFNENFSQEGIKDPALAKSLQQAIDKFDKTFAQ